MATVSHSLSLVESALIVVESQKKRKKEAQGASTRSPGNGRHVLGEWLYLRYGVRSVTTYAWLYWFCYTAFYVDHGGSWLITSLSSTVYDVTAVINNHYIMNSTRSKWITRRH
jgi:hypothetical protein